MKRKKKKLVSIRLSDGAGGTMWQTAKGVYHREDGPAIIRSNGNKYWMYNGKYHREDGPAIEFPAQNYYKFYLHGKEMSFITNTAQLLSYLKNKAFW